MRRKNDTINGIFDNHDNQLEGENIAEVFKDYYKELFTGSNTTIMDSMASLTKKKIPDNMIDSLNLSYTEVDLNNALNQMYE